MNDVGNPGGSQFMIFYSVSAIITATSIQGNATVQFYNPINSVQQVVALTAPQILYINNTNFDFFGSFLFCAGGGPSSMYFVGPRTIDGYFGVQAGFTLTSIFPILL